MSNTIRTFNSLPSSLQGLAIELAVTRARQDQYANLRNLVKEAVVAAGAALEVGVMPEVAVGPAKPAGPNPDYKDPEIFDPKAAQNSIESFKEVFSTLLNSIEPKEHCGRADCVACNAVLGELKPEFSYVKSLGGVDGELCIERSNNIAEVYKLTHKDRSVVVGIPQINELNYFVGTQIVKKHGKRNK